MGYARPSDLVEALSLMAHRNWTVLAGGTDLYPATQAQTLHGDVLDISALPDLDGISETQDHWRIGARVTWTEIRKANLPPAFRALQLAAAEVGGIQIQNSGTVIGNLCNASPAADGVPALMILDAVVELASASEVRKMPLGEFLIGPRQTARRPDELVVAIHVPKTATGASGFLKLGARKYLVISIAMVAVRLDIRDGVIAEAAIAVGACSGVATRMLALEQALIGATIAEAAGRVDADTVAKALSPIDDVRADAAYRSEAAAELIRRTITQAGEQA